MVDKSFPFQLYTQSGQEQAFSEHVTFTQCLKTITDYTFFEVAAFLIAVPSILTFVLSPFKENA